MKKKILFSTILASLLLTAVPVEAQGTANVSLVSENKVQIGDTFKVSLQVSDINDTYDGVVSMGGHLSFDNQKLEFVSSKAMEKPYQFQMNINTMMIAGLDFTLRNGFYDTTTVYEFTFKALEEGITNITLERAKLTDSMGYITTTVLDQTVEIEKNEEVVMDTENTILNEVVNEPQKEETVLEKTEVKPVNEKPQQKVKVEEKKQEVKVEVAKTMPTPSPIQINLAKSNFHTETVQKILKDFVLKLKNWF